MADTFTTATATATATASTTPEYIIGDESVYEPSEDTFLLLDALSLDLPLSFSSSSSSSSPPSSPSSFPPSSPSPSPSSLFALEIGCGTGLPIVHLSRVLGGLLREQGRGTAVVSLATDINPAAACTAMKTASLNGITLSLVQTDLIRGLEHALHHSIDFLLFNPPYVVTPTEEISSSMAARAWGGVDGREVTDRFLPLVDLLLSPCGCCYLLLLDQNRPQEAMHHMEQTYSLLSTIILSRKAGREKLHIVKFWRHQQGI